MRNLLYGFFSRSFIVFAAISIACHKSKVFIVKSFTKKRFYASHLSRRFCIIDKSIRHFWNQSPRITYSSNPSRRNVGCMRLWNSQTSRVQQHHNNRHSLRRLPCNRLCSPVFITTAVATGKTLCGMRENVRWYSRAPNSIFNLKSQQIFKWR